MTLHLPTSPSIWSGRNSETLSYFYQAMNCLTTLDPHTNPDGKYVAILGYVGDEGVKRNLGRPGATKGPEMIRRLMASMAYHLPANYHLLDLGDIQTLDGDMEASHELITQTVRSLLSKRIFPVLIGGGHDLAYAHGKGVFEHVHQKSEKLGIINLDAHFDLRVKSAGKGHSGSPFLQLGEEFPNDFHYLCLGIQRAANPPLLFETAKRLKAEWMEIEDFTLDNWQEITILLDEFCSKVNKIYLSIDLDGFSSAYAPGVSAPSPSGFSPELAFKVLDWIAKTGKLISMDVVELNPKYDQDNSTARLAARCVEFVLRKLS
ncbi:formimidoylglutamase [Fontibacter flavus]|uniref:Formimidoylglutamase n=1 Tax=Fontibacter flavus TaxID=654838 RepID=A0ABV6FXQ0_9BACT